MLQDFPASVAMLCELLTDDGGPSSIPLWMFSTCYKFLAELDFGSDQELGINNK